MKIRRKTNNFNEHGHNEFGNKSERHKEVLWKREHRKFLEKEGF